MRIGITCYPTYGGSGAVATELGIALARRGHEIHFITYQQPFRLPTFLPGVYFHEVDVGRYPLFEYPPYDLALAVRMHEVVREHGLDLLHVHYAIPHATSAWIAREMLHESADDIAVVTTLHGTDITIVGQDHSFHAITKFSIEKSDRISAVSRFLRDETIFTKDNISKMKLLWKIKLDNEVRQMHSLFPPLIVGKVDTSAGPKQIAIVTGVSDNIYAIDVATGKQLCY